MLSNEINTAEDLLKAWDSGDTIWSIELGGIGPGYEQAIQIAAVEIARELKDYKPVEDKTKNNSAIRHKWLKPKTEEPGEQ